MTLYTRIYRSLGPLMVLLLPIGAQAEVQKTKFDLNDGRYLIIEVLDDDLVHFEASAQPAPDDLSIFTSPMVLKTDYSGPSPGTTVIAGNIIETSDLKVEVDTSNLCVSVFDKKKNNALLTTFCSVGLKNISAPKGLDINPAAIKQIYGLGQEFKGTEIDGNCRNFNSRLSEGDWIAHGQRVGGKVEGQDLGNSFQHFQCGAVGNVQIPVYYALGDAGLNYAVFLDNVYWQKWDFKAFWWQARMFGDQIRWYVMTGPNLPDLRADFMELTGTPPVPPRKAFGLWVSEFGYRNFGEIDNLLNGRPADGGISCSSDVLRDPKRNAICPEEGLRDHDFPVDGFVLDLNWFGGVKKCKGNDTNVCNQENTYMGRLDWDEDQAQPPGLDRNPYSFKDPDANIDIFHQDHIGLVNIEESYVVTGTKTFNEIDNAFTRTAYRKIGEKCDFNNQSQPIDTIEGFFGKGKMIDWTDAWAGIFIHDQRRFPNMTLKGITSHWTDLGEPEKFDKNGCYDGIEVTLSGRKNHHSDIHNLYNFMWNKSIWDGYVSKQGTPNALGITNPRPLVLTRSGAAGIQRFGVAMWSGDIAGTLFSLANHYNAQMHMSFSGIDYFGSDIGGFRREVLPYNNNQGEYRGFEDEAYTQWFANGAWTDIPVRPHTDNEFKLLEGAPRYATSPHLVGKKESNLANLRQRYELVPYYYSLAHLAHQSGAPVVPPPVFYFQDDPNLHGVGHQKMIGRDLMIGIVANHGEYERDIYLPAGRWVNYHTNEWINSRGKKLLDLPVYRNGLLRIPAFVRAGAIIPKMHVDTETKDAFGHRKDDLPPSSDLVFRTYADPAKSQFTLFEDDGISLQYDSKGRPRYHHRTTELSQQQTGETSVEVSIAPTANVNGAGSFPGAVSDRHNVIELVIDNAEATEVTLNGTALPGFDTVNELEAADSGWVNVSPNLILAKSAQLPVSAQKQFVFTLQQTPAITSVNFVCDNGFTQPGQSIFVVGSIPQLGAWNPKKAIKLDPNIYYEYIYNPPLGDQTVGPTKPVWTGVVAGMPPKPNFEWKCIRLKNDRSGDPTWQSDPNNTFQSSVHSGYAGHAYGTF